MTTQTKQLLLQGAFIPALPLALDKNRQLDEKAQRRLIRYYLHSGVDGIAAAVHTTQFAIRDPQINLFERVLTLAMEEITLYRKQSGRTIIAVAGACGSTEQAVREAMLAAQLGYDYALLSPGGLDDYSEGELLERTRLVAQHLEVIGFYLQPAVGGRLFSYAYWEGLCATDRVAAIKCAAFNRYLTNDVARAIAFSGREIALYTGNDDSIIADLLTTYEFFKGDTSYRISTVGGLLGHWAVWTHQAVALFKQLKKDRLNDEINSKWLTLAAQITDANSAFFDTNHHFAGCIAGIHEVLHRQGLLPTTLCIDPEEGLSPGQKEEIDRVYAMYPHLNDDAFVTAFLKSEE